MPNNLVSIILPVYNCEKYIKKCIESIIRQNYTTWELVIVNDGSTDGTAQLCEIYVKTEQRVRYFEIQNNGVSNARNYGLSKAEGEYIFFVDADDYLDLSCLENAMNEMQRSNSDIVVMAHYEVDDNQNKIIPNRKFKEGEVLVEKDVVNTFLLTDKIGWEIWGKLFKKDLLQNIQFRKDRKIAEDALFLFEALLKCKSISLLKTYGYYYRSNMSSVMAEKFSEKNFDILFSIDEITEKAFEKKYIASEAFKLKYYIWFIRRFNKKSTKQDIKIYSDRINCVRNYISNTSIKDAKVKLSKKYFVEYLMIRYIYGVYGIAIKILY